MGTRSFSTTGLLLVFIGPGLVELRRVRVRVNYLAHGFFKIFKQILALYGRISGLARHPDGVRVDIYIEPHMPTPGCKMMSLRRIRVLLLWLLPCSRALTVSPRVTLDRRAFAATAIATLPTAANAALACDAPPAAGILENRDRGLNEKALISTDFYFVTGRRPPRVLDVQNLPRDDPKWNAYSRHGSTVMAAAEDLAELGRALKQRDLAVAALLLDNGEKVKAPSALRSASRKALLLADGLLISANSGGLGREILVARYYVNEFHYATERIMLASDDVDWGAVSDLWRLGADSYNSFFVCVNKAVVPKVGEKFVAVRV